MYKLYFYVPEQNLAEVKAALFSTGAGQIGNYSKCSWQTKGIGQFLPEVASNPAIGKKGQVKELVEYKVEMVVRKKISERVINKLKEVHPYEEPAYGLIEIET